MFIYPLVEGSLDLIASISVILCLISYTLFLFLESVKKQYFFMMTLLLLFFLIFGGLIVGLIVITTGIDETNYFFLLAIYGTVTGSLLGVVTFFKTARENLFPIQDRLLMRRGHLKFVGGGIIFICVGSCLQLIDYDKLELLIIPIIIISIGIILFFISIAKTREHLREVSLCIIENQLDDLKAADRIKTQIIDVSSHEMRTPIAIIKGHFDLLETDEKKRQMTPENRLNCYDAIKRNIERIERSLANIYDYSEIRRDLFDFHFENANIIRVLNHTIDDMRSLIKQRGLNVSFNVNSDEINPYIEMDPVRISQVIRNLLENAIKYSLEGEIIVNFRETRNEFIVSVEDQGIGINEETMKTIFNPFKDQNLSTIDVKGLGLGLFISKKIIEGHNGKIWAISEGQGSRFFISLPKERKRD